MENKLVVKSLKGVLSTFVLSLGLLSFTNNAYAEDGNTGSLVVSNGSATASLVVPNESATTNSVVLNESATANSVVLNESATAEVSEIKVAEKKEEVKEVTAVKNVTTVKEEIKNSISPVVTRTDSAIDENGQHNSLLSLNLGGTLLGGLLGDVEVGILDYKKNSDGSIETSGLVKVNVKNSTLLGNIHLGVLDNEKRQKGDESYNSTGLVKAKIDNQLLGKIDASVLENTKAITKAYKYNYSGVLNLNLKDTILGDAHVGVIEKEMLETDSYVWKNSGLLIVNTKGTPILGDLNLGVGAKEEFFRKDTATANVPVVQKPVDPSKDENPTTGDNSKPGSSVGADDSKNPTTSGTSQTTGDNNNNNIQDSVKQQGFGSNKVATSDAEAKALPVTGSALDSSILLMISVLLMGVGVTLRKRFNVSE